MEEEKEIINQEGGSCTSDPSEETLEDVANGGHATQRGTHRDDACYPGDDTIYEIPEESEASENEDNAENDENADNAENADNVSKAEKKLQKMVEEMGAETVLEIIRDNRNAAIRQILAEVEAQRPPLQSGVSAARRCGSIFDLAAMA